MWVYRTSSQDAECKQAQPRTPTRSGVVSRPGIDNVEVQQLQSRSDPEHIHVSSGATKMDTFTRTCKSDRRVLSRSRRFVRGIQHCPQYSRSPGSMVLAAGKPNAGEPWVNLSLIDASPTVHPHYGTTISVV